MTSPTVTAERIEALLYDILPNTKIHADEHVKGWCLALADTQSALRELLRARSALSPSPAPETAVSELLATLIKIAALDETNRHTCGALAGSGLQAYCSALADVGGIRKVCAVCGCEWHYSANDACPRCTGKQPLPSTVALADVGECETCGGATGFLTRDGAIDVCDDPFHDERESVVAGLIAVRAYPGLHAKGLDHLRIKIDRAIEALGTGKQPRPAAEAKCATCDALRDELDLTRAGLEFAKDAAFRLSGVAAEQYSKSDVEAIVSIALAAARRQQESPAAHTAQVTRERERGDAFKDLAAEAIGESMYQEYRAELQPEEREALQAGVMCLEAEALAHRHPTFSKGATKGDINDGEREGRKASDDKLRHAAVLRRLAEQGSGAKEGG